MENTPAAGTTTTVTVGNMTDLPATWKSMDDLTIGDLVVNGPANGCTWMTENRVASVRDIKLLGGCRTQTEVTLSTARDRWDTSSGNWSRMRFLTLDGPIPC